MGPSKRKQQHKDENILARVEQQKQLQQRQLLEQQIIEQQEFKREQDFLRHQEFERQQELERQQEQEQREIKELEALQNQQLIKPEPVREKTKHKARKTTRNHELVDSQVGRPDVDSEDLSEEQIFHSDVMNSPIAQSTDSNDDASSAHLSPDFHPTSVLANTNHDSVPSPGLDTYSTTSVSTSTRMSGHVCDDSPNSSYDDHEYKPTHHTQSHVTSPQVTGGIQIASRRPRNTLETNASASPSTLPVPQTQSMSLGSSPYAQTGMASLPNNIQHPTSLPQQSQSHFFRTPEKVIRDQQGGLRAGERGFHFGFDTIPKRSNDGISGADISVLAGYEGGLEVYTINKKAVDPVYSLSSLRGGVVNAKLIPWSLAGNHSQTPLVAVVIHGPMLPNKLSSDDQGPLRIDHYQTTIEVYSLKTNECIDVLLRMPPVPISTAIPITSDVFEPPQPPTSIQLRCDHGFVVVSCGNTGEVFVFSQTPTTLTTGDLNGSFGCIAKLWTSVQQRLRNDDANRKGVSGSPTRSLNLQPILALSGRWLAYCPPTPGSQVLAKAEIGVKIINKGPGLKHATAPPLPTVSVETDEALGEGVMNKIVRGTTQELIYGARWVGQHGVNAWQTYWNAKGPQVPDPRSPEYTWGSYPPTITSPDFPPTHGIPSTTTSKDPGLVCLVDLESLGNMTNVHPFATFLLDGGCSYLSFAPTGLLLYTASTKGDIQTVWDLMRSQHTKSSLIQVTTNGQMSGVHVRQVAQFSRMTETRVVDVSWTKPNGGQVAVVTERGTVHLLDMPASAFVWPPPRRRPDARKQSSSVTEATTASAASAVSMASTAIGVALGAAPALMNRARRSSANPQAPMTSTGSQLVESATQGGRMIAASISSSIGKTGHVINQLRQTADNKVTMPTSAVRPPAPGCVTWAIKNGYHALYVIGSGIVRAFPSKTRRMSTTVAPSFTMSLRSKQPRDSAYRDINIPALPDATISDFVRLKVSSGDELVMSDNDLEAGNTVTFENYRLSRANEMIIPQVEATLPDAEIESSAPYQPFHTDRRIAVMEHFLPPALFLNDHSEFDLDNNDFTSTKKSRRRASTARPRSISNGPQATWAFGQDLVYEVVDLGLQDEPDDMDMSDPLDYSRALPASAMERTLQQFGVDDSQIVVTTRRRRAVRHMGVDDQDGFFEDDCDFLDFADQRV